LLLLFFFVGCRGEGGDRFLSHHELRSSVGPVLNLYPHNGVCVYQLRCPSAYACAYACVVSSLCPVYFSLQATLNRSSTTLALPSQPTHTGWEFSRPVKSRSYRHSGQTASTAAVMNATSVHSLQRTMPNPLSCLGFTPCVSSQSPQTILGSTVQTTLMWTRFTTGKSTSLTQSGVRANCASRLCLVLWHC